MPQWASANMQIKSVILELREGLIDLEQRLDYTLLPDSPEMAGKEQPDTPVTSTLVRTLRETYDEALSAKGVLDRIGSRLVV